MNFSIITPSVQRESLYKCVESVNSQTHKDWQHVVILDVATINESMFRAIDHPQRIVMQCDYPHRNGGNTCRHNAWTYATGEFHYFLDDDNYLATPTVLEELAAVLEGIEEQWAIFPIYRHRSLFFFDPPKPCYFDTGNAVARREIARWPDIPDYASDAVWLNGLKEKGPYKSFPSLPPVMVMPGTSFGAGGGINGQ